MTDQNDIPLRDALEQYLNTLENDVRESTLDRDQKILGRWMFWLAHEQGLRSVRGLRPRSLIEYADSGGDVRPSTQSIRMNTIWRFLRFLFTNGFISEEQYRELRDAYCVASGKNKK